MTLNWKLNELVYEFWIVFFIFPIIELHQILTIGVELWIDENITDDWFTSHDEDVLFIFALRAHRDPSPN